jgi:hypothetical protein
MGDASTAKVLEQLGHGAFAVHRLTTIKLMDITELLVLSAEAGIMPEAEPLDKSLSSFTAGRRRRLATLRGEPAPSAGR